MRQTFLGPGDLEFALAFGLLAMALFMEWRRRLVAVESRELVSPRTRDLVGYSIIMVVLILTMALAHSWGSWYYAQDLLFDMEAQ